MTHILHVIDAFADKPFAGNPAAVCVLEGPADEAWMQLVAQEMNLSETSFLYPVEGGYSLRWFTPALEVKLCGHATLASAFALWETGAHRREEVLRFQTKSGWLVCKSVGEWIEMDFPASTLSPVTPPGDLGKALGAAPSWIGSDETNYLVELASEKVLRSLSPDFNALATFPVRGIIVTARSDDPTYDFVSRFFAPASGINEDPVTGSAHCTLGPYWQAKLGKPDLLAYQASARGGVVSVGVRGDRVLLGGQAILMSRIEFCH